jgi:hypothetical protein
VNNKDNNPNNEQQFGISDKFREDLSNIYRPAESVPPEVDRAVMDRANQHFAGQTFDKSKQQRFRWASLWKIAAAAAVIIFAFSLELTWRSGVRESEVLNSSFKALNTDIDRNGRVDILDAFILAKQIESTDQTEKDSSLRKQGWDINGDGLINNKDVDEVAYAAVRLDKGVL